jgi:hypothetical protein
VAQEQPCAGHTDPLGATIATAIASAEVITEAFESLFAQIVRGQALPASPLNDVFRRSNVAANGFLRVAALEQLFSKTFNLYAEYGECRSFRRPLALQ